MFVMYRNFHKKILYKIPPQRSRGLIDNYKYRFLRNIVGGTIWRCTLKNCCSSIIVDDENNLKIKRKDHNHPPNNKESLEDESITFNKNQIMDHKSQCISLIKENEPDYINQCIRKEENEEFQCSPLITRQTVKPQDMNYITKSEKILTQSDQEIELYDYISSIVHEMLGNQHFKEPYAFKKNPESNNNKRKVSSTKEDIKINYSPVNLTSESKKLKNAIQNEASTQEIMKQKYSLKKIKKELNNQPDQVKMNIYKSIPVETIPKNDINESYKMSRLCNSHMIENSKQKNSKTENRKEELLVSDMTNVTENTCPINYDDWQDPNELVRRLKVLDESRSMDHKEEISRILYELRKARFIY